MNETVIKVENLSKRYRIGLKEKVYDSLAGKLTSMILSPFRNLRNIRQLSRFGKNEESEDIFWALKDVSFEVKRGEVLGIIGKNGAGKSTLLKILSHITKPTSGRVTIHGRMASLLEVGTGFHPELTGRENVYLNGTILGMKKREIDRKFDEIIAFSGVEKFMDTPVKRYSSGMRVRLGFAVAAHLDPEILIIDEVLAVGDIDFQKRCIKKMKDIAEEGKTVLLVSHNMSSISRICKRAILLDMGLKTKEGQVDAVVREYIKESMNGKMQSTTRKIWHQNHPGTKDIRLLSIKLYQDEGIPGEVMDMEKNIYVEYEYEILSDNKNIYCGFHLSNSEGVVVFISADWRESPSLNKNRGYYRSVCEIPGNFLAEDAYYVRITSGEKVSDNDLVNHIDLRDALVFQTMAKITGNSTKKEPTNVSSGVVKPQLSWTTYKC